MQPCLAIFWSEGQVTDEEAVTDCAASGWVPLLVTRPRDNPDSPPTLLVFKQIETARAFIALNHPKDWVPGVISLTPDDMEVIAAKGWKVEECYYGRRKLGDDHPTLIRGAEVHEFVEEPTFDTLDKADLEFGVKPKR